MGVLIQMTAIVKKNAVTCYASMHTDICRKSMVCEHIMFVLGYGP